MKKRTHAFPRTPFAISLVLICGYNMFVSMTLSSTAPQQQVPAVQISEQDKQDADTTLVLTPADVSDTADRRQTPRAEQVQ